MWSPNDKMWSPKWKKMRSPTSLKYEIIDVFYVKYAFKPKKCRQLVRDFVPHNPYQVRPQTPYRGEAGPQTPSFVESKKSLNYTMSSSVLLILIRTVNREYLRRNGRRNGPARDRVSWVKNNRVIRVVVRCKRLSGNCGQE